MSAERTFICPRCLMNDPINGTPNSVDDIAFSMPEQLYQTIHTQISKLDNDLAREINKNQDLIKCITWSDIQDHLKNPVYIGTVIRGTFTLTADWLTKNKARFHLPDFDSSGWKNTTLCALMYSFHYDWIDGHRFPVKICNADEETVSDEHRCANCGRELSPDTGKADELRILLQGSTRAGKTSCILSIIDRLVARNFTYDTGFRMELVTNSQFPVTQYHNWLHQELKNYRKGYKVEKTPTSQNEPSVISLLLMVDDHELVLTFVDMPGEYFDKVREESEEERDNLLKQYVPIYRYCDVVWTCLQHVTVVQHQDYSDDKWNIIEEKTGLMKTFSGNTEYENYRLRFRDIQKHLSSYGYPIKRHAVILTKTDSILDIEGYSDAYKDQLQNAYIIPVNPGDNDELVYELKKDPRADGVMVFDEKYFHAVTTGVSNYIHSTNDNMHKLFRGFADCTCYFAMAAYGHAAAELPKAGAPSAVGSQEGQVRPEKPVPYNTQAPLMWSMAVTGHLPIKYTVSYKRTLSFLEKLVQGRQSELVKETTMVWPCFEDADQVSQDNLLGKQTDYQYHEVNLKKGEQV